MLSQLLQPRGGNFQKRTNGRLPQGMATPGQIAKQPPSCPRRSTSARLQELLWTLSGVGSTPQASNRESCLTMLSHDKSVPAFVAKGLQQPRSASRALPHILTELLLPKETHLALPSVANPARLMSGCWLHHFCLLGSFALQQLMPRVWWDPLQILWHGSNHKSSKVTNELPHDIKVLG